MSEENILNEYIELINKGYCSDCNELNCIDNFPHKKIAKAIEQLQQENERLKQWDKNKDSRNSRQRVANAKLIKENEELKEKEKFKSCGFSASIKELYRLATVLDEFEKWLQDMYNYIGSTDVSKIIREYYFIFNIAEINVMLNTIEFVAHKLQELKERK